MQIQLLTSPPIYSTKEQHDAWQATTPANGELKHDPVLHHWEQGAAIKLEPGLAGFNDDERGSSAIRGGVYVTEGALSFFDPSTSKGFSVPYPTLSLHAISRQPISSVAHPSSSSNGHTNDGTVEQICVYCQLDENNPEDYDNMPEEELKETRELSIFPAQPDAVQAIYSALSKCAALHPSTDPQQHAFGALGSGEDDDDSNWIDADEDNDDPGRDGQTDAAEANLTAQGRAQLQRLEDLITWNIPEPALNRTTAGSTAGRQGSNDDEGGKTGEKRKR